MKKILTLAALIASISTANAAVTYVFDRQTGDVLDAIYTEGYDEDTVFLDFSDGRILQAKQCTSTINSPQLTCELYSSVRNPLHGKGRVTVKNGQNFDVTHLKDSLYVYIYDKAK